MRSAACWPRWPAAIPAVNEAILRGMARGWPKDKPAQLDEAGEEALKRLTIELPAGRAAQLVRLAEPLGQPALRHARRRDRRRRC